MKIIPLLTGLLCTMALTGCGLLSSASNVLSTPFNLLKGMSDAVGRSIGTVTQNDAGVPQTGPADIETRGRQVQALGDYSGLASRQAGDVSIGKTAAR